MISDTKNPIDILPVDRPFEDDNPPDPIFFYKNVVIPLFKDVFELEEKGIPINLDKVADVKETVTNVLDNVRDILANNSIMTKFLEEQDRKLKGNKELELESKKKTYEDFIKPFNISDKVHRTRYINAYLNKIDKPEMVMDEWSIKDVKKLNLILASTVITGILNKEVLMQSLADDEMIKLAKEKADIYNKSKIESKKNDIKSKRLIDAFNPGSAKQKREFFEFCEIESDSETKAGAAQWNRKELERVLKHLDILIEDKESNLSEEE